ncbi:unnamed protein product [Pieris macdunnoughi]|uniref:UBX domain-containing protein n=1 Tax=Pieris macdunnoughi TaxID=345717 RepID=A0A821VZG9_9NEOP|nr:unnamed protein product [Pieris macdunnoughi]
MLTEKARVPDVRIQGGFASSHIAFNLLITPVSNIFLILKRALLDFLTSKGYPQEKYKVISRWPRRDLTAESQSSTLIALELYPQETIILEER